MKKNKCTSTHWGVSRTPKHRTRFTEKTTEVNRNLLLPSITHQRNLLPISGISDQLQQKTQRILSICGGMSSIAKITRNYLQPPAIIHSQSQLPAKSRTYPSASTVSTTHNLPQSSATIHSLPQLPATTRNIRNHPQRETSVHE